MVTLRKYTLHCWLAIYLISNVFYYTCKFGNIELENKMDVP